MTIAIFRRDVYGFHLTLLILHLANVISFATEAILGERFAENGVSVKEDADLV